MLSFDLKGLLTPNTNIVASVTELKQYFVDAIPSDTRQKNFDKYIYYSTELKNILNVESMLQWINGSFVTNTKNPKDIDLITFIDVELRVEFEVELKKFEAKGANDVYGVDAYILTVFPESHSNYFFFQSDKAYWMELFSKTKRDKTGIKHHKGFLEITF